MKRHLNTGGYSEGEPGQLSLEQSQSLYAMRGLAIIVVVISHVTDWPNSGLFVAMPLFFFLSGYLFRAPGNMRIYITSLTRKLIVPYLVFLAIISTPNTILLFQESGVSAGLQRLVWLLTGGEQIKGVYAAFWYPSCFFFAHLIYSTLNRILTARQLALICSALLGLAFLNAYHTEFWLPLALNVACMGIPLIHAGRLYRQRQFSLGADKTIHYAIALLGLTYAALASVNLVPELQMKLAQYGLPIITIAAGLFMVVAVKKVFDYMVRYKAINLIFGNLGKASLIIMFVHQPVQMLIVSIFDVHNEVFRIVVSIAISYAAFRLMEITRWGSAVFLGKPAIKWTLRLWPNPELKPVGSAPSPPR